MHIELTYIQGLQYFLFKCSVSESYCYFRLLSGWSGILFCWFSCFDVSFSLLKYIHSFDVLSFGFRFQCCSDIATRVISNYPRLSVQVENRTLCRLVLDRAFQWESCQWPVVDCKFAPLFYNNRVLENQYSAIESFKVNRHVYPYQQARHMFLSDYCHIFVSSEQVVGDVSKTSWYPCTLAGFTSS